MRSKSSRQKLNKTNKSESPFYVFNPDSAYSNKILNQNS